jgi:DNA-binding LytR/AlgR family response regulator
MPARPDRVRWPRAAAEAAFLVAAGLVMAFIGPYGTGGLAATPRAAYWVLSIVGGGVIGIALDETLGRRFRSFWRRVLAVSFAMTPAVALLVIAIGLAFIPRGGRPALAPAFFIQVLVISVLVMTLRALLWRPQRTVVETRTVIATPLPEAEAAFRRRLSSRRRAARLIAVRAEDHFLRVFTDAGEELVALRFADALDELSGAAGFQTHRSWWVAADAVQQVRWRKGGGEARLVCGVAAPVSRKHAPMLKAAGWF